MSITGGPDNSIRLSQAGTPRWVSFLFVLVLAGMAYLIYASIRARTTLRAALSAQKQQTQALAAEVDNMNVRIADLTGQVEVASQKLQLSEDEVARARGLAQQIRERQVKSDKQMRQAIGQVQADASSRIGQVSTDLTATQSDVAATKAELEATKNKLQTTIGDLGVQSGLIARNHDEVEELKRVGDRAIFEFSLGKTKSPQRVGPIQLQVRKLDSKHYRYTMNVIADDKSIEKRDRDIGEPVQFYVRGARVPYEIVVFDISKNQLKGYLSTPKALASPASPSAN